VSQVTRQAMTDDSGLFTDGTEVDKAFVDQVYDQIDSQCYSSTNPTVEPHEITDEVVAARGNLASLGARLNGVVDANGVPVPGAGTLTATQAASFIGKRSIAKNDDFATWPSGAAAAPSDFTLSGAGAAVARTGAGESDTETLGAGTYAAKLTYGSAEVKLTQSVLSAAEVTQWSRIRGKKVFVGIRCKASVSNQASLVVDDGVTTTRGGQAGNNTYHTGGGSSEWIYAIHTISGSATKLDVYLSVASSGAAYFGGLVVVFSDVALLDWMPKMTTPAEKRVVVLTADSATYKAVTPADNTATGWSYVLPAGTLKNDGDRLRVTIWCDSVGSANVPTEIKFAFGATTFAWRFASDVTRVDGAIAIEIIRTGAATQKMMGHGITFVANTQGGQNYQSPAETLANAITLSTKHGASASSTDYVQQVGIGIEYLPAQAS
jgi:hypothetical protein